MREKFLDTLGKWAGERTYRMLAVIILITIVTAILASQLSINMDLSMLLPEEHPMTNEMDKIFNEFNGANTVFVVVEGQQDKMIEYAEHIALMIPQLEDWIEKNGSPKVQKQHQTLLKKNAAGETSYTGKYYDLVDYKTPVEFLRDHALMLTKSPDLENIEDIYHDPNLVNLIEN
ncbi:MAG: hypothetical protein K9N00_00845, partial [Candidatus Marinimicrobia bacterium]|nr:hypothetical protein [Candidatus Neomarinimicrobiota bacterium]